MRWAALCLCLWGAGCGAEEGCDFEAATRDAAGAGVIDCQIAPLDDTARVDQCAVQARDQGHTFRALYEQPDGSLQALIHAAGDRYLVMRTPPEGGTIERASCEGSAEVQRDGRTFIECTGMGELVTVCP